MGKGVDLAALQLAMQTEKEGYEFYTKAAEQAAHPLVRETFTAFARDEQHHMELIKSFYDAFAAEQQWPWFDELFKERPEFAPPLKTIFHEAWQWVGQTAQAATSEIETLCLAAGFERDGVNFYERLREHSDNPDARRFYERLRDMEREHLKAIGNSLQYLEDSNARRP